MCNIMASAPWHQCPVALGVAIGYSIGYSHRGSVARAVWTGGRSPASDVPPRVPTVQEEGRSSATAICRTRVALGVLTVRAHIVWQQLALIRYQLTRSSPHAMFAYELRSPLIREHRV